MVSDKLMYEVAYVDGLVAANERLQARVERLEGALLEIVKETDGIDCDGCYVRNEIARKALGAGTEYPEAPEQQEDGDAVSSG